MFKMYALGSQINVGNFKNHARSILPYFENCKDLKLFLDKKSAENAQEKTVDSHDCYHVDISRIIFEIAVTKVGNEYYIHSLIKAYFPENSDKKVLERELNLFLQSKILIKQENCEEFHLSEIDTQKRLLPKLANEKNLITFLLREKEPGGNRFELNSDITRTICNFFVHTSPILNFTLFNELHPKSNSLPSLQNGQDEKSIFQNIVDGLTETYELLARNFNK